MKNFLVIYYAPSSSIIKMKEATPEEKMASMKPWMDWKAAHDENIVNFGAPLTPGVDRGTEDSWKESNKEVSGFSIVQGNSLEDVQKMFVDHPHVSWDAGCKIGIYEYVAM